MALSPNLGIVAPFESKRRQLLRRGRIEAFVTVLILSVLLLVSARVSEFLSGDYGDAPMARVAEFLQRMNPHLKADHLLAGSGAQGSVAYWFYAFPKWSRALFTSVEMALVATAVGATLAFAFSLLMARTVTRSAAVRQSVRFVPNLVHTMPSFIFAMLLVQAVGPGPVAGTLALIFSCFAGLARPFSEILENADVGPMESVRAAGGGRLAQIRYGLFPIVAPNMLTYVFAWIEINVSVSTSLGIVGAGGIGEDLAGALGFNQFQSYFAMMIMIAGLVVATDIGSEQVRHRFFGLGQAR